MHILPFAPDHLEAIISLSIGAWAPVFHSMEQHLDPEIYALFYPEGWEHSQRQSVEATCLDPDIETWVAVIAQQVVGFVSVKGKTGEEVGEVYMIAVDPAHQRKGIAAALMQYAITYLKKMGIRIAMVDTGGDPGHAPARATYEKMGFSPWPISRFFKKL